MGKVFNLRKNGENGTVTNWYLLPFFSLFSHFGPVFLHHNPHPVCYARYFPIHPPPPVFPRFPPFPLFPHLFQPPKSWFGGLVSSVVVSADACVLTGQGLSISHQLLSVQYHQLVLLPTSVD